MPAGTLPASALWPDHPRQFRRHGTEQFLRFHLFTDHYHQLHRHHLPDDDPVRQQPVPAGTLWHDCRQRRRPHRLCTPHLLASGKHRHGNPEYPVCCRRHRPPERLLRRTRPGKERHDGTRPGISAFGHRRCRLWLWPGKKIFSATSRLP